MKMKISKLLPIAGTLFTALSASVFGQTSADCPKEPTCSSCPTCPPKCGPQGTYERGTFREITPNAGPFVCHGADVYVTADFIYWNAIQDGLDYGVTGLSPSAVITNQNQGTLGTVGNDWAPGFKVGLGLDLAHDGWDLFLEYTWLNPSDSGSITGTGSQTAQTTALLRDGTGKVLGDSISSNWNFHFNVIDLSCGRNFFLSQYLTMRPFCGLKTTWQDHDWTSTVTGVNYAYDNSGVQTTATGGTLKKNRGFDVWGIGLRAGVDLGWYITKNWSIRSKMAWTAMWADYDNLNGDDYWTDPSNGVTVTSANLAPNPDSIKYIGELSLGTAWETWFCDDNYHFAVLLGWEKQVWINWGAYVVSPGKITRNDLGFQGLTLKFRFDF